jgi:hypothetical protein
MLTVSIVGSPVNGLANSAPSSVILVNLLRETSWKPPLSYGTLTQYINYNRRLPAIQSRDCGSSPEIDVHLLPRSKLESQDVGSNDMCY